jgi:hypothetical protein
MEGDAGSMSASSEDHIGCDPSEPWVPGFGGSGGGNTSLGCGPDDRCFNGPDPSVFGDKIYDLPGFEDPVAQEEDRHESIITTGYDPELGISRDETVLTFSNTPDTPEENQKEAVTSALYRRQCQPTDMTCAQNIYDNLQLDQDAGPAGLHGGNYNFTYGSLNIDLAPCFRGRSGDMPSLHFPAPTASDLSPHVHLDTANPFSMLGAGAVIHLVVDVVLGNTIYANNGIPR